MGTSEKNSKGQYVQQKPETKSEGAKRVSDMKAIYEDYVTTVATPINTLRSPKTHPNFFTRDGIPQSKRPRYMPDPKPPTKKSSGGK